jgi:FKBP-type peptidyl-prolyl cis-trans isomerase/serine/threonine protein kinase
MNAPDTARCPYCFGATRATPCPHCGWQPGHDNQPPALALGQLLDGRYRIGRVLGHGGFGITYLAWDDNLHLRLAIKEYLPRDCASRAPDGVSLAVYSGQAGEQFTYGLDRFLEEARTLAHFDQHPGIVTVKNFFRAHGTGYCVMDYVEGITLRQYLDQQPGGRISIEAALKLLMPVADALRAVHKEGLLHRDIAPDNIYLTQDGRIKLLDFGAARFAAGEHSKSLSIILKPGYAPEEQYRTKGKQGPWTDVYGLGATLYRAITGQVPPESLDRLDNDDLVPPSRLGIAITPGQEATLLKALAVRARDRIQDIQSLQRGLQSDAQMERRVSGPKPVEPPPLDPLPAPQTGPAVTPDTERRSPRRATTILLGVGALVLLIGLVAYVDHQQTQERDRAAYATASQEDTASAYRVYLDICAPNSCAHGAEARKRIATLQAQAAAQAKAEAQTRAAAEQQALSEAQRHAAEAEAERQAQAERRQAAPQRPAETPSSSDTARAPGNADDDGKTFSDRAAQEPGAIQSSTGLVYRAIRQGTGASPKPTDRVKVRYSGTLTNGQEFDNSDRRGGSDEFRLTEVEPCWTVGLQYMKVGGKARLVCPPDLVYVEPRAGNVVPPNATLIFDVELLEVGTPNEAKTEAAQSDVSLSTETLAQAKAELESLSFRSETLDGNIHLIKGQYKNGDAYAKLTDFVAIGQINGKAIAAAILEAWGGGTGVFLELIVFSLKDGHLTRIASTEIGDRVVIKTLQIKKDRVSVVMVTQGPNDPLCCPTLRVTDVFSLKGNKLIRASRR